MIWKMASMKMKAKSKVNIVVLKHNVCKLRANYQLPFYLSYLVRNISSETDVDVIVKLRSYTEHFMRIKGYYKKYPQFEKSSNDDIAKLFQVKDSNVIYIGR